MAHLSVVLPTYAGDNPTAFREAIKSCIEQTRRPDELLIIRDGTLPQANESVLQDAINSYSPVTVVNLQKNQGRAFARKVGIEQASGEFVAMMDSDDISLTKRFETEETFLATHPEVDVVGAQLLEFDPKSGEDIRVRTVPTTHDEISSLAKSRSPINQSTVMFRRKSVLAAGNYRDVARMEDYDLWARMLVNGAIFANIPKVLVKARTGPSMYARRGGWEYAREEIRLQRDFLRMGFISVPRACVNLLIRVPIRFAPNTIRRHFYESIVRSDPDPYR